MEEWVVGNDEGGDTGQCWCWVGPIRAEADVGVVPCCECCSCRIPVPRLRRRTFEDHVYDEEEGRVPSGAFTA